MAMRHLGRDPQWVRLSGKVAFPDDIKQRYSEVMERATSEFEQQFASQLASRTFEVSNVVVMSRGLTNHNMMCFANASMQLLFASPFFVSFARFMCANLPLFSVEQREKAPTWRLFCEFLRGFEFAASDSSDGGLPSLKALSIAKVTSPTSLKILDPVFGPFKSTREYQTQEDAIQFLMFFLGRLHDELIELEKPARIVADRDEGWMVQGTNRRQVKVQETQGKMSPLSDIFSTLVSSDTLENGRSRSIAYESFLVLPLDIKGTANIEQAIAAFCHESVISDSLSKKNAYNSYPKTLIIGLKRFEWGPYGAEKIPDIVEYPALLTLPRPVDKIPIKYQLSAVVEHVGNTPDGGHYLCYARRFDATWTLIDDSRVTYVSNEGALRKQAYMLLYNLVTSVSS